MTFKIEVIMDIGVDRGEFLQRIPSPEPAHIAPSSSEPKMTVFGPIFVPSAHLATIQIS